MALKGNISTDHRTFSGNIPGTLVFHYVSPDETVEIRVLQTDAGVLITTKDKNGPTSAMISNGKDGAKGDKGDPGEKGETGPQGSQGEKGDTGAAGANGKDGTSATHSWNGTILTITSASGTSSTDLKGSKGDKGDKGDSIKGDKGDTGNDGHTPERGIDYYTEADKKEMVNAVIAALPVYNGEVIT